MSAVDSKNRTRVSPDLETSDIQSFFVEGSAGTCDVNTTSQLTPDYRPEVAPYITTPVFTGIGLDDLTTSGTYSGGSLHRYIVEIDATGTPDSFKWSQNDGQSWVNGVSITGSPQPLSNGISVDFGVTTGHTVGERWEFNATVFAKFGIFGVCFTVRNNQYEDTAILEIVDKDGFYAPAETVLGTFHKDGSFYVPMDGKFELQVNYKKDVPLGTCLRFSYTSSAEGPERQIVANYLMVEEV